MAEESSNKIGDELETIRQQNPDGMLLPAEVVAAAKDKKSPLHACFTWDNSEAAQKWRETEARQLIRVHITHEPRDTRDVRLYVSVPSDRTAGGGYRRTDEALARQSIYDQLIREAARKTLSLREMHSHLRVMDPMWDEIAAVVDRFMRTLEPRATG